MYTIELNTSTIIALAQLLISYSVFDRLIKKITASINIQVRRIDNEICRVESTNLDK